MKKHTLQDMATLLDKGQTFIMEMWKPDCVPCSHLAKILSSMTMDRQLGKFDHIVPINIQEWDTGVIKAFNVMSVPTLLFIVDGKVVDRLAGVHPSATIQNIIKKIN